VFKKGKAVEKMGNLMNTSLLDEEVA